MSNNGRRDYGLSGYDGELLAALRRAFPADPPNPGEVRDFLKRLFAEILAECDAPRH